MGKQGLELENENKNPKRQTTFTFLQQSRNQVQLKGDLFHKSLVYLQSSIRIDLCLLFFLHVRQIKSLGDSEE